MFKTLGEKKRQLDNMLSISNVIKDLVIYSKNEFFECYIDSQFHIYDLKYIGSDDIIRNFISDCGFVEDVINEAISGMQLEIQRKTQEILNSKHN